MFIMLPHTESESEKRLKSEMRLYPQSDSELKAILYGFN